MKNWRNYESIQSSKFITRVDMHKLINTVRRSQTQSTVNFQLILQFRIIEKCYTLDIEKSLSLIVIGCISLLKHILKFQQKKLKVQKIVKAHKLVSWIVVIKNSIQFITNGDQIMKIQSLQGIQLSLLQSLCGHSRPVRCLLISRYEDLIIFGRNDQTIAFWIRNGNACKFDQQILEHSNFICGIRLGKNQQQKQVNNTLARLGLLYKKLKQIYGVKEYVLQVNRCFILNFQWLDYASVSI
ncbi:unnamed protein product [Paramecium primaurelia]|uniref:Uncharacterized protein n=1 Tax=Paramecium primaurelia TaxID=5886 RepID=A0A8S1KYE2_PARPR|nr:unnamed protein product [Paramecium primaurelia]CAD8055914.1 unnamed protein product [Paramecium primaurelia]